MINKGSPWLTEEMMEIILKPWSDAVMKKFLRDIFEVINV